MLKIVYPTCCGIDVHKNFVVATVARTDKQNITTYTTKRFSTFTKDLKALKSWLAYYDCNVVCMESTGKYWIPVYNILESSCVITLAHPKYVRAIKGKKTDKKDSIWIADLHKHDLVVGSFIPCYEIRQLRDLTRYRSKLVSFRSSEKNRVQNSLTVSNIMLSSVVSDTFGKSSTNILNHLLENPNDKDFDLLPLIHGSMKKKLDDLKLAIDGSISLEQASKISLCKLHYEYLNDCLAKLDIAIANLVKPFYSDMSLLTSMPGIRTLAATIIIAEIGNDMSQFPSSKHLCSWAGLAPCNDQSAGKKKSVRISRAGVYIKPILVQCALAAIKDKKSPCFRFRYENIKRRRGHKKALIAVARMMLTAIYNMLLKHEPFDSSLYEKIIEDHLQHSYKNSIRKAVSLLESQGYHILALDDTT